MSSISFDVDKAQPASIEQAVLDRYAAASRVSEAALCCPIDYDPTLLEKVPAAVKDIDYGCGDPSRYVRPGDVVVDLGSGSGKICYMASQIVGAEGRVIGVDMTDDMLDVARENREAFAATVGWSNLEFHKARIQDLRLDVARLDAWMHDNPGAGFVALQHELQALRKTPLIPDNSVDVVISNCVLNLVDPEEKGQMFGEIFRVLKKGGRAAISDIVADEAVPAHLQDDPDLWSGCISGALTEQEFLRAFEDAGFHGVEIVAYGSEPWQVVEGIEFRSVTVQAWKGKQGDCYEQNQAVVYKGPFKSVLDDDQHVYPRGERVAVCAKTFQLLRNGPYSEQFLFIEPNEAVPEDEQLPFDCGTPAAAAEFQAHVDALDRTADRRSPQETKGGEVRGTFCEPGGSCC